MERRFIKSGVAGLDELLGGGILEGSIITVSGPTGSGKSTLAAQFICNGALQSDEAGVYIAIEESKKDFMFHMGGFGFDLETLEKDRKFIFLDYPVHEVDQIINQSNAIYEIIHNTGAKRVVIDSIMPIALFFHSDDERKKGFLKFIENLRKWNVTILIVSEDLKMSDKQGSPSSLYGIESFTDGWINMYYSYDERTRERKRYLEVIKMKGAKHSMQSAPVAIDANGITLGLEQKPSPAAQPRKALAPAPEAPRMAPPPEPEERPAPPNDEDIEKLVERAFMAQAAPKPKAKLPAEEKPDEPPPAPAPAQKLYRPPALQQGQPQREPETKRLSGMVSRPPPPPPPKAAPKPQPKPASKIGAAPRASVPPRPPLAPKAAMKPAAQKPAVQPKPASAPKSAMKPLPPPPKAAQQPKAAPKEAPKPPAPKAPPKESPPSPKKEAMARLLSQKAPPPKAAAPARPAPAKMSDSIAQRIAEAKKRIMKKE